MCCRTFTTNRRDRFRNANVVCFDTNRDIRRREEVRASMAAQTRVNDGAEHGLCLPTRIDPVGNPQAVDALRIDRNDCGDTSVSSVRVKHPGRRLSRRMRSGAQRMRRATPAYDTQAAARRFLCGTIRFAPGSC